MLISPQHDQPKEMCRPTTFVTSLIVTDTAIVSLPFPLTISHSKPGRKPKSRGKEDRARGEVETLRARLAVAVLVIVLLIVVRLVL
jgi:hypothetical protein